MTIFAHSRWKIFTGVQHPLKHTLDDFAYANPALPPGAVTTMQQAMDWVMAVLYPQTQPSVATTGDLPTLNNTLNDFRVVEDDGDGKAAAYRWEQREGEGSPSWHKIYDMDWGSDSILEAFQLRTQDLYVFRRGYDDLDSSGNVLTGSDGGQTIYGGATANKHLTLRANSGDGVGPTTGFVQFGDNARPYADSTYSLGTTTERFLKIWTDEITIGTVTILPGSITDSSGAISFDNENLTTTGTITTGTLTIAGGSITDSSGAISFGNEDLTTTGNFTANKVTATGLASIFKSGTTIGDLTLADGSITSSSGAISFADENLSTTGTLSAGDASFTRVDVDATLRLDGNSISVLVADTSLNLAANGTGVINLQSAATTLGQTVTGTLDVTGSFEVDDVNIDGNIVTTVQANQNLIINPNGTGKLDVRATIISDANNTYDIGDSTNTYKDFYFSGSLKNATQSFLNSDIFALRNNTFRDSARTLPVQSGDTLFWDAVSGTWLASHPDSEIDHGELTGLTDDDHTQYLLLAGRSGGQSAIGGTGAGDDLTLESTSHGTKGDIFTKDDFLPFTTASYSGGWSGTDIGESAHLFRDVYTAGEFKGFRLENLGALPASSVQRVGRLLFYTSDSEVYLDDGSTVDRISLRRYQTDTSWNGSDTSKSVTVSGVDARNALWQLKDNTNNFEIMGVKITSTGATNVTITTNVALPAGSYRLTGLE